MGFSGQMEIERRNIEKTLSALDGVFIYPLI